MKKYYLKNKTYETYYKSKYSKGSFHYVANINDATSLTKGQAIKLLDELRHKENFEIIEKRDRNGK